jgi:hypothetical protein
MTVLEFASTRGVHGQDLNVNLQLEENNANRSEDDRDPDKSRCRMIAKEMI